MSHLKDYTGVAIALLIITVWVISLGVALPSDSQSISPFMLLLFILWETFLYVGLFCTGHDSMHQSVAPHAPRLNRAVGILAFTCYGFLPYQRLQKAHELHHQYPASDRDPDFHDGKHRHVLLWYLRFMGRYWDLWQWAGLTAVYHSLHNFAHIPHFNLLLLWVLPSLLSSAQLFYFGTYLVHRDLPHQAPDIQRSPNTETFHTQNLHTHSNYRPYLLSLITCYHFGYHQEHHEHPDVPWWKLPSISKQRALTVDWVNGTS